MASIQYERKEEVAAELTYEEKVKLDELIKQAESQDIEEQALDVVAYKEGLDKAAAVNLRISVVVGALTNLTRGSLSVLKKINWKGYSVREYSNPLHRLGGFVEAGLFGVKAAVVYYGKNYCGVECAWLLAYVDTPKKKVYAEVGRKDKIAHRTWPEIEHDLDTKGKPVYYAHDPETGTRLFGTIAGTKGGSAVAAGFNG